MKYFFTLLIIALMSINLNAQSVNDYKYVIVPEEFDFLKSPDQYQVNSLTKFLFNKYGFEAYLKRDEKPFDNLTDPCKILYADVKGRATFIKTTLEVVLKDCNDQVIFKTSEGTSKDKEYKRAYHNALREAFYDIEALQYSYNPAGEVQDSQNPQNSTAVSPDAIEVNKKPTQQPPVIKEEVVDTADSQNETSQPSATTITYTSEDGFYKVMQSGTTITFYDDTKKIGVATIGNPETFDITTTDFSGKAFFLEGRLVIQRKIKGIAGVVEMIFTKQ
ncbi:hypothetical protein [Dokdonia donghaensis]|uniref:hypothetical protein n=1 Tax=Dokdonia donghaensis TaxID=326320 RepID=UPI0006891EF8|nr:hypothetical protein [Dokdonia donghaensis]ANH60166.1 hypothetical protein I597_1249 [Dokdonia donghaensis DSW-1]